MNTQVKGTLKTDWTTQNLYSYTACNTSLTAVALTNMRSFIFRIVKPLFYLVKKKLLKQKKRFLWDLETSQSSIKGDFDSYWKVEVEFLCPTIKTANHGADGTFPP